VEDCGSVFRHGALFHGYKDANGIKYLPNEIELQMDFDYWEACQDKTPDSPDYWTRLEHQYAGMAMQSLLNNNLLSSVLFKTGTTHEDYINEVVNVADEYAKALITRMKNV
jgi:hypothetical protein